MQIISTNNCNYTNNQRNSIYKSHLVNTVKYYFLKILIPLFKLNINIVLSDYFFIELCCNILKKHLKCKQIKRPI